MDTIIQENIIIVLRKLGVVTYGRSDVPARQCLEVSVSLSSGSPYDFSVDLDNRHTTMQAFGRKCYSRQRYIITSVEFTRQV